jgi:hypothetical protein
MVRKFESPERFGGLIDVNPAALRFNPALLSVVSRYPLSEFPSHAPGIGRLRFGIGAASYHSGPRLRITRDFGIRLGDDTGSHSTSLIEPDPRSHRSGVFRPPQKPASDGERIHFGSCRLVGQLRVNATIA